LDYYNITWVCHSEPLDLYSDNLRSFLLIGFLGAYTTFSGTWTGSWESYDSSEPYGYGTLIATITQSGSTLSGKLNVSGSSCGSIQTNLSGKVSGNTATINASVTCGGALNQLTYTTGIISGNEVSGTWTLNSNGKYHDSGTFSMSD